jgi:hypothetical protein
LDIASRHAVNAGLLSLFQVIHDPQNYNFHNWHGMQGILWMIASAIGVREFVVWYPKIMAWSQNVPGDVVATVETTTRTTPADLSQPSAVTKTTSPVMGPTAAPEKFATPPKF